MSNPANNRRPWDADLIEHVATLAAERAAATDDAGLAWWRQLEDVCDEMLAGQRDEAELASWIRQYEIEDACSPHHAMLRRAA